MAATPPNIDPQTVEGFGQEWSAFDQSAVPDDVLQLEFDEYFEPFRWDLIGKHSIGFDMGCGSGRWAKLLAPRVGHLHCIDPSDALDVARAKLAGMDNVSFHRAGVSDAPIAPASMDFGICIGVVHHIPDTAAAIRSCVELLKPGAPMLFYIYYRFDNRPLWFRALWRVSDIFRRAICRLPFRAKVGVTTMIAALVYWPLARMAGVLEKLGFDVSNIPLTAYRRNPFYSMRTDALDRFGTRLEQRFTKAEIRAMMEAAGCEDIRFSTQAFWCVCGTRKLNPA